MKSSIYKPSDSDSHSTVLGLLYIGVCHASDRFIIAIVFSFFLSINCSATSLNPLTLKQLYQHSDLIVIAKVVTVNNYTQNKTVYSSYSLQVEEYLKGSGASSLTLNQLGGKSKQYHTLISGLRQYESKQRVVLFLSSAQGKLDTLGYAQGSILVSQNTLIFDNYHFFLDPYSLSHLQSSSIESKIHKKLTIHKHISYLKELIQLYAS